MGPLEEFPILFTSGPSLEPQGLFYSCVCVCVSACQAYVDTSGGQERVPGLHGIVGPLEEQQAILTTKAMLQPQNMRL